MKPAAVIPESLLRLMSPAERRKLGKSGRTMAEIEAEQIADSESELQSQLKNLLALREIVVCSPKFGKRTGILPGWPDLTFAYRGVPCAWEAKHAKGQLEEKQVEVRAQMQANGWRYAVIRSVAEAREFLQSIE